MMTPGEIPTGEDLLRHARWIRRLAASLLRDEAAAEDLVQDTWVAALTHPPAAGRLRPWLRQVATNFARMEHRGGARRAQREASARPPALPPGPDELAQRLEAEQRLTQALARLDEPFRSTLMLRYYEDLEPSAIAARLGLPGGTVRWRLSRGLELLRERLDEAHGGDRRAWSLSFLPLARLDGAAAAGAAVTAVAVPGLLLMNTLKLLCAAAALLVLALGLSVAGVLPAELSPFGRREAPLEVGFRPLESTQERAPARTLEAPATEPLRTEVPLAAAPEESTAPPSTGTEVDARVLAQGRPLAGARMVVVPDGRRCEPVTSGENGLVKCAFELHEERAFVTIEFHALGFASQTCEAVCARGEVTHLGSVDLLPGGVVSGRVVDERGLAIAGCRVTLGEVDMDHRRLESMRLDEGQSEVPACTSDATGSFRLAGVPSGMARLWARAPGYLGTYTPPLEVRSGQESFGLELSLRPLAATNRLHGVVLDPHGDPVPFAQLAFQHSAASTGTTTSSERQADADGRFEFVVPEDTRIWMRASDPEGRWNPGSVSDVGTGPGEIEVRLIEARLATLLVRERGGAPVTFFSATLEAPGSKARLGSLARAEFPDGRARLALPAESFVVRVLATAHQELELGPFDPASVGSEITAVVERVPGLAGFVLRGDDPAAGVRVVLVAAVEEGTRVEVNGFRVGVHPDVLDEVRSDAEGNFLLTPRREGSYFVRAEPEGAAPSEVGPIEIGPGLRGPPVELRLGVGGAIEGSVRLAGAADPEGSIVAITRGDGHARTRRVGADGAFRFEHLLPGPWRVELATAEVLDTRTRISSISGGRVEAFDLRPNCTVFEGRTSHVDVSDGDSRSVAFDGRLTLDGEPALGWAASLGPRGVIDFDGGSFRALDEDGRFHLSVAEPGDYSLALRFQGGANLEQYLFDEVVVRAGDRPWELDLRLGRLLLAGPAGWDGRGMPPVVHHWKGPGKLFSIAAPVITGEPAPIRVPAGEAELRAPNRVPAPDQWPSLRTIRVPAGGELRVELSSTELPAREPAER